MGTRGGVVYVTRRLLCIAARRLITLGKSPLQAPENAKESRRGDDETNGSAHALVAAAEAFARFDAAL
jgi:hypothetical protein